MLNNAKNWVGQKSSMRLFGNVEKPTQKMSVTFNIFESKKIRKNLNPFKLIWKNGANEVSNSSLIRK